MSCHRRGLRFRLAVASALCVATVGAGARADSGWVNLHVEGGAAVFLRGPQSGWFGPGGGGAMRAELAPIPLVGIQLGVLYAAFPTADYDFSARGLEQPRHGYAVLLTGGIRLRPLNDQSGYALSWRDGARGRSASSLHGNLWIDVGAGYVHTGGLDRVGLEAGIGYEISIVDRLQLGPYVRYLHVFQPDDEPFGQDALAIMAGLTLSVAFASHAPARDSDGDGSLDPDDRCPTEAEDADGFEDEDGCPDPDNDRDGVLDADDRCPTDAEDLDGSHDDDGCPDRDDDDDGIADEDDPCRLDQEDRDGFQDDDGCPDDDNDADGVPDVTDRCPSDPEDPDRFQDEDGCPDPDNDQDGFLDQADRCPSEAEVVNGVEDEDGCPDSADVEVVDDDILLRDRVYFDFGMSRIRGRSTPLLDQVVQLLVAHPEYALVSIEGHCDEIGSDEINQTLSEERADRVLQYIVGGGVAPERLDAVGFGRSRPLASGRDEATRQMNRRVELRIVRIDRELQRGAAMPRSGRGVAPDLGPGGVILRRGEEPSGEGRGPAPDAREGEEELEP